MHIADDSQRAATRELQRRIEATRLGAYAIAVAAIVRVDGAPPQGVLRCFVAEECQKYGGQLLTIVNGQLAEPKLVLQDFSRSYTPDGSIRGLHFEIYFSPGPITVTAGTAKSAC